MEFKERVAASIERDRLLEPGQTVVVGVSGGPDSLALAQALFELGYPVHVAHFDHGLRSESRADAGFVRERAAAWGAPFHLDRAQPGALAAAPESTETAARRARYAFFLRIAIEVGCRRVAVGHTLDDQAETVLMHFLRGAGSAGLAGMRPARPLRSDDSGGVLLVRPLLSIRREEVEAYCRSFDLEPRVDPSNRDVSYHRNWIRHAVIPLLEQAQPNLVSVLGRNARVMGELADYVQGAAETALADLSQPIAGDGLRLDRHRLAALPAAVQGKLLQVALGSIFPAGREVSYEQVEHLRRQAADGSPSRQQIGAGYIAEIDSEWLTVRRPGRRSAGTDRAPQLRDEGRLPESGTVPMAGGWRLRVDRRPLLEAERRGLLTGGGRLDGPWEATLDAGRVVGGLAVRCRRPGDRIRPLGMSGTIKLSDLFINEKIEADLRERWPLVVDEEKVCWVPGMRVSDEAAVVDQTREVVELEVTDASEDGGDPGIDA